ncbi:MAG: protein translocase subunit SecF [Candidatus Babeliales bacterium]
MINFLKYRYVCAFFSFAMMATFFGGFFYKRATKGQAFDYSVEFTGGTQVLLGFEKPIKSSEVIDILEKNGWSGAVTREFGPKEILIRVKEFSNDVTGLADRIKKSMEKEINSTVKVLQTDSIGQGVGESLAWNSMKAIIIGLILMLFYIAFRFWSVGYALGAVIALFHDAIAILLYFMLFDKEISSNVISAILAVLGYSINDTIVIFTQIRENLKTMRTLPIEQVINISLTQTLRRTILTSLSTALIVVSLIVLGGEALRDLSTALLIGIIFGTYSSIYIATTVMLMFYKEK